VISGRVDLREGTINLSVSHNERPSSVEKKFAQAKCLRALTGVIQSPDGEQLMLSPQDVF